MNLPVWPSVVQSLIKGDFEEAVIDLLKHGGPLKGAEIVKMLVGSYINIKAGSINQAIVTLHVQGKIVLDWKKRFTPVYPAKERSDDVTKSS
jgi:hypothetical protein